MTRVSYAAMISLLAAIMAGELMAQETPSANAQMEAVQQAIQSYVSAFNAQDVDTLATHWSSDGVYISKISGQRVEGRDAVLAGLRELFASDKPQLNVKTGSIEFVSPNVALENGIATVTDGDGSTDATAYRAIYVKQNGKWLIDRMTEEALPPTPDDSAYQRLKELQWLIGSWTDQAGGDTIRFECDWTKNQTYISRKFSVSSEDQVNSSGLQIIGWDPTSEQIRSWLFDSNGGFVEGTWTKKEDRWFVKSVGRFPDGAAGSFTSIFRPVDQDSYGWQKVNRQVDGKILPNIDEVIVSRRKTN